MKDLENPEAPQQEVLTKKQKKAAKRAALIQEIAEAVYSLGVQRQNEAAAKQQQQEAASKAMRQAQAVAKKALHDAENPIEAAFYKEKPHLAANGAFKQYFPAAILKWAIEKGILPKGSTQMPSTEEQYLALAKGRDQ